MDTRTQRAALLTWHDIREAAGDLSEDLRGLLLEIAEGKRSASPASVTTAEGPWFIKNVMVQGHVGIGQEPVGLEFTAAPGLTVISARNGTGKTSLADAVRHGLSGGAKPKYDLLTTNLHYPHRSVAITLTNGKRDIAVLFGSDETVRWQDNAGIGTPPPAEWIEAFARYMPVLLYPEISPIINNPSNLHDFLKGALEMAALEELQSDLKTMREAGSAAQRRIENAHATALTGVRKAGSEGLAELLAAHGSSPTEEICREILSAASSLPSTAPPQPSLPDRWTADPSLVAAALEAFAAFEQARDLPAANAETLLGVLDKLLADSAEKLEQQQELDVCPVCAAPGRNWARTATSTAERLRESTKAVRTAERAYTGALRKLAAIFPAPLPASARTALAELDSAANVRISQWDRLAAAAATLTPKTTSAAEIERLAAETTELAAWYSPLRAKVLARRDDAIAAQASARAHAETWLTTLAENRQAFTRHGVAERLNTKVDQWLRQTREEIFRPIGEQVKQLWSVLNSDADLKLTNIALAGGTQLRRKVQLDLASGDLAVPQGKNSAAIMSTGQRNALSLATYLPRATQVQSPFGFLVLDDPIHVFDTWRVRYLAKHLIDLARRFQIVVFTHDDRLWRELRSLGAKATHIRLDRNGGDKPKVIPIDITRPGEQMLNDLNRQLDGEQRNPLGDDEARKAMTLAICRQALDTEIVTQLQVLGRRNGLTEKQISDDQNSARTTRDQLDLLDGYAQTAGLPALRSGGYRQTIDALNGGAHGKAPIGQLRKWVKDTRALIRSVNAAGA